MYLIFITADKKYTCPGALCDSDSCVTLSRKKNSAVTLFQTIRRNVRKKQLFEN